MQRSSEVILAFPFLRGSCERAAFRGAENRGLLGSDRVDADASHGEERELHARTAASMRASLMSCPIRRLGLSRAARQSAASGLFGTADIVMDPLR